MKNNLKIKMSTLFLANAYILSAASSKNPLEGGLTLIKNWVIPGALLFCVYNLVRAGLKMNGAVGEQEETQAKKAIKNNILGIAHRLSILYN